MDYVLIATAILLLISILASKISDRFGVPTLVLFLILGMLAGSDGPGGIYFDDPALAQSIGVVALVLILWSGGLDTEWKQIRPVLGAGMVLATLGVFLTALALGIFASLILGFSLLEGFLLGAIVSSTDAAAVFSVLRSKGIHLGGKLKPLLELESGSNDPMAIFLTVGLIGLLQAPEQSPWSLVSVFVVQMVVGVVMGLGASRIMLLLVNRLRLGYEGLYPVLTISLVFLLFGLTNTLHGNGFLAVYLAGVSLSRFDFVHKRSLLRFHDGLAWLMQIAMFLTLGLLVFPSRLVKIGGEGLLIALCLMLVARPLGVFLGLLPFPFRWREKAFVAWVGLRGAVPIILATYPLLAGLPNADQIFNIVFFVVLTSVLLQGTTLSWAAQRLKVDAPPSSKRDYPIEYTPMEGMKSELKELPVPADSEMVGKSIVELDFPDTFLVILIAREKEFIQPSGGTVLDAGDMLLVLSDRPSLNEVLQKFSLQVE